MQQNLTFNLDGFSGFYRRFSADFPDVNESQKREPTICLLHGYCDLGSVWQTLAEHVHKSWPSSRILVPDLPGFGMSEAAGHLSMTYMADWLDALMKTEKAEQMVLIGHSMGGYVALEYANAFPAKIKGLGLFHSHAFRDSLPKIEMRQKTIDYIVKYGAQQFIGDFAANLFAPFHRKAKKQLIEQHVSRIENTTVDALVAGMQAMIDRRDRTQVLTGSDWPVLFVMGRHDESIPLSLALKQVPYADFSQIELLEPAGHMGMLECPEESACILDAFIKLCISQI